MTRKPSPVSDARPRVVLYARVSTEMQAEEGSSLPAQLTEMREYATHRGWEIVAEFVDAGLSGSTTERPGLTALLAAVTSHACDIVLVHELSRLSRSIFDTFKLFDDFGKHQVGFASVRDANFDFSTPTGRLFLTILAALNQYYTDILKMHTAKSKHQRVRDGLYNFSSPPFGYQHVGDKRVPPEIVAAEAAVVRLIFERYASGRYSFQQLADHINDLGHRTRQGKRFSKDTIADMLRNRFYRGQVVYKQGLRGQDEGDIRPGLHEPLVSPGLWEACREIRERHHSASRSSQPQVQPYLLGQITYCHACNRRLRSQGSASGAYYREMSNARGFDDCPYARQGTRADPVHTQMHTLVQRLTLPPDWQAELAELLADDSEATALDNRRDRLRAELRRLNEDRHAGLYDEPEAYRAYCDRVKRLQRDLAQTPSPAEIAQIEQAAHYLTSLHTVWDQASEHEQRALMQLMVRQVWVDVTQSHVLLMQPTAPFIPLFRAIPGLQERELGLFTPVWTPAEAPALPFPSLPPLTAVPATPCAPPFLAAWPEAPAAPEQRISPTLSHLLKALRQQQTLGELVLDTSPPGVPPLQVDGRKWPEVTLQHRSLEAALTAPPGSVSLLHTPLAHLTHPDGAALTQQVLRVLSPQGLWHWVELVYPSMPAHWLFTYFPETWRYAREHTWSAAQFFNHLREQGFQVRQTEHTYYQAVALGVALAWAQQRPGLLAQLPEATYTAGLARLAEASTAQGAATLVGSEITLVEIEAYRGAPPAQKLRGRPRESPDAPETP